MRLVLILVLGLGPLKLSAHSAKQQEKTKQFTNNKTFYSKDLPMLKPSLSDLTWKDISSAEFGPIPFDANKAKELAGIAKKTTRYKRSHGKCMRFVRLALSKLLGRALNLSALPNDHSNAPIQLYAGRSAEDFIKWAKKNPVSLCEALKLANVTAHPELASQTGAIHLFEASSCGFNRRYGHIEILTNPNTGEACSDHCRTISRPCHPDLILAPVSSCQNLIAATKKASQKKGTELAKKTGTSIITMPLSMKKPLVTNSYVESRLPAVY